MIDLYLTTLKSLSKINQFKYKYFKKKLIEMRKMEPKYKNLLDVKIARIMNLKFKSLTKELKHWNLLLINSMLSSINLMKKKNNKIIWKSKWRHWNRITTFWLSKLKFNQSFKRTWLNLCSKILMSLLIYLNNS